jgi:brefeldin A-inhibited guanine nucleotide-exchange protein
MHFLPFRWSSNDRNDKLKMALYRKEVAHIQKKSQQLMNAAVASEKTMAPFCPATQPDLVRPMFSTVAWPLMATLSLLFESSVDDDSDSIDDLQFSSFGHGGLKTGTDLKVHDLCLLGFEAAIRVASMVQMEIERDAFVTTLCKLSGLAKLNEIRPKNVKAIKTMLAIANRYGLFLLF